MSPEQDDTTARTLMRAVVVLADALTGLAAALEPYASAEGSRGDAPSEKTPDAARPVSRSEPWLRKRLAARHLGVSVRWVEMRQADAGLPFYRVGGMNVYRASELDDWLRDYSSTQAARRD